MNDLDDILVVSLEQAVAAPFAARQQRLELADKSLAATSPYNVLKRGYSITRLLGGAPIRRATDLARGATIETLLDAGRLVSEVTQTHARSEADEPEREE